MSINENIGGLYGNLKELRESSGRHHNNYFKALGLDYKYVENGNNILDMITAMKSVKDITHPIVVHIHTHKGYGFEPAEKNKARWHYGVTSKTWEEQFERNPTRNSIGFPTVVSDWLDDALGRQEIVVIEPATPLVLQYLRCKYPKRFIDTGMTEAFAVSYAAGLAKGGIKPFLVIDPGFAQRAYDQVVQNVAMQNLNVSIVIVGGAIECIDQSHVAMHDIAMLTSIPNLVYLAPTSYFECRQMLDFMKTAKYPTAIRLGGKFINQPDRVTPEIMLGKFEVVRQGEGVAILAVGLFLQKAMRVAELLFPHGIDATVINPRFISSIDRELLDELVKKHDKFVTIEDGVVEGGFGQKVASYLANIDVTINNYGADKEFTHYIPYDELMNRYRLNPDQIVKDILAGWPE